MAICVERSADFHMAQLMPLPHTVSCFSKIQIDFTFLVPAHLGIPGQGAVKRVCVCVLLMLMTQINLTSGPYLGLCISSSAEGCYCFYYIGYLYQN